MVGSSRTVTFLFLLTGNISLENYLNLSIWLIKSIFPGDNISGTRTVFGISDKPQQILSTNLYLAGLCGSVRMAICSVSGLLLEHQTCGKKSQEING